MGWEPTTFCKECDEPFDVYHALDERICESCKEEIAYVSPRLSFYASSTRTRQEAEAARADRAHWNVKDESQ